MSDKLMYSRAFNSHLTDCAVSGWMLYKNDEVINFPSIYAKENPGKADGSTEQQAEWRSGTQYFVEEFIRSAISVDRSITDFDKRPSTNTPLRVIPHSMYRNASFGQRKPDFAHWAPGFTGAVSVDFFLEVKGRYSNEDYSAADIGQVIDTNIDLLEIQPFRHHAVAALTDGFRFQFFKTTRHGDGTYTHEESLVFTGLTGWKVLAHWHLECLVYF
jgi:hypothetical protein